MGPRRTENWSRQLLPPGDVSRRRREYASLRDKHNDDPRVSAASGSLESNNPLMASKGSSWDVYFRTREVRATIALDLERLHPGDDFYSSGDVQRALLDLLTVWALENPSVGYKQGMHELASLVFSQRASDVAGADSAHAWGALASPPTSPVVEGAPDLSAAYVEHDAYAMFAALMGPTRASNPDAPHEATPLRVVSYFEDPPKRGAASEVQAACDRVFRALGAVDAPLRAHLAKLDVEPQLFLLRWLRVLFSREFHLEDALRCWDAIFSANAADAAARTSWPRTTSGGVLGGCRSSRPWRTWTPCSSARVRSSPSSVPAELSRATKHPNPTRTDASLPPIPDPRGERIRSWASARSRTAAAPGRVLGGRSRVTGGF